MTMKNNKCSNEYNDAKPVYTKTLLSKEQFKEFYTFLNIIKLDFNDVSIINGKFRSRSNDLTCIVEAEFSYFKGIDLYIENIQIAVNMISKLDKKAAITILIDDMNVSFSDGYQSVQVKNADPDFINNNFITDKEMKEFFDDNVNDENLFIKETLPKYVVCNIDNIAENFNTHVIKVKHAQDDLSKGYFYISNQHGYNHTNKYKNRNHTIKLKEPFIIPMKNDQFFYIPSLPFIFNKAEMTLSYYLNKDRLIVTNIYTTTVGGLKISIFARSAIHEAREEG